MPNDEDNHSGQFNASLHLPGQKPDDNPAADLIRKKVEAAYVREPDAEQEIEEVKELKPIGRRSKHQQFIYELTGSGRPLHEVQTAWHEYYAGLTDREKHEVWQEFYDAQIQAAHHPALTHAESRLEPNRALLKKVPARVAGKAAARLPKRHTELPHHARRPEKANPLHSLLFGLGAGSIVILIFMFSFFNERIIAPFIQPSRNTTNIPLINSNGPVGSAPEVIIPKINAEVPVVYDVSSNDANAIEAGLNDGVVHYPGTALPGQDGNVVIVGHSSGNIFNLGKYKFAFSLLRALDSGDTFYIQKDGKRYVYQVYEKQVVKPTDVSVLGPADKPATATLITCDPPGLSTNRLVVTAAQISPDPSANTAAAPASPLVKNATFIPSDSPTLWSRLVNWFKR